MRKIKAAIIGLGVFAGLGGASHGPGEMLQGNVAPTEVLIQAWPQLTALNGEPAMTVVPNYLVTGVLTIIFGLIVALWAAKFVQSRKGGAMLILLTVIMLLVGGGIVPPLFGIAAGIIGALINHNAPVQGVAVA